MEYTYRNSPKEKEITIHLQVYDMVVISDKIKRIIPYAEMTEIRLNKRKGLYFIRINTLDYGTVLLTSQSFGQNGERIDQSRAYMTFIRVLHMHLLEKGKPSYFTGFNLNRLLFNLSLWASVAFLFFFTEEYFDFVPGNPLLEAIVIFSAGALLLFGLQLNHWPKPYSRPTSIPLHMLPTTT